MRTSLRGQAEIVAHEAVVTSRYRCPADRWTIGPGITAAAGASVNPETFHGTLTLAECMGLFREVLPRYEVIVDRLLGPARVAQHEYDALVSLAWNVGDVAQPKTTRLARSGNVPGAIDLWRRGETPGLKKRRDAEMHLARTGEYVARWVKVYPALRGAVQWDEGVRVNVADLP